MSEGLGELKWACPLCSYGNELDDLIVAKSFQGQGLGQKLLLWGMNHIKKQGYEEIILHVAEWNQNAVKLYLKNGFRIKKRGKVRRGQVSWGFAACCWSQSEQ